MKSCTRLGTLVFIVCLGALAASATRAQQPAQPPDPKKGDAPAPKFDPKQFDPSKGFPGFDPSKGGFPGFDPTKGFPGFDPTKGGQFPGFPGFGKGGPPDLKTDVQVPKGFVATLFGVPPDVNYPTAITAKPTGELFVGVDEQGSIGHNPGGGKVVLCIDTKGEGKADKFVTVAKMDHPRGLVYRDKTLWVLHPPFLTVYHLDDEGKSVQEEDLVTGLTTDMIDKRGGDHTTNGIRMGVDGSIYIASGDYGMVNATGKDGRKVTMRGGILRVRPDGTELEIYATGFRNPFDLGIDPYMNIFTRDNTNDGAGWDERVSQIFQSAHYGYTQLYSNFPEEIMPMLGMFGNGGGTGVLFLQNPNWPEPYNNTLFTQDWGRSEIYHEKLVPHGATFDLTQELFFKVTRPTGIDIDGNGRLFIASWKGGEASMYIGPDVGFIARVVPEDFKPAPFPDLKKQSIGELVVQLGAANHVLRIHSQWEILQRGKGDEISALLLVRAYDKDFPLPGRVAALYTLKQLNGKASILLLYKMAQDPSLREFALRALADRSGESADVNTQPFIEALSDKSERVKGGALIGLGRLNAVAAADKILPLTSRPKDSAMPTTAPVHAQPDADRVLTHLAVKSLIAMHAVDACIRALDGPHASGALFALRSMYDKSTVDALVQKLRTTKSVDVKQGILAALVRMHDKEADYKGEWWGIRPENSGPLFDAQPWEETERIAGVLKAALVDANPAMTVFLNNEIKRDKVKLKDVPPSAELPNKFVKEDAKPVEVKKADPKDPNQIGNMTYEMALERALKSNGSASEGKQIFKTLSCSSCHTDAQGEIPKGPHLVDIGKRYKAPELIESILKPSAKIAQGFESYAFVLKNGKLINGFIVSIGAKTIQIRDQAGMPRELDREEIESRRRLDQSMMPEHIADSLTPEQLAHLLAYLQSLN